MAGFNQTSFNSTYCNSGQSFSRWLASTIVAILGSLQQSFRPPRRMAQSATTRVNSEAVGTDRSVREIDTNTDRIVERF